MGGAPGICLRSGGQSTGVSSCLLGGRPLPKLGDCSRCARPAGTLAAEKYVLAGGAGQNMIASFSAGCGRRNSARRALPGESVGWKGWLGSLGLLRAAARTCWACPAGRVGWVERLVGPFGSFCGLLPGPAGFALPGESVGWKGWLGPSGFYGLPPGPAGFALPGESVGWKGWLGPLGLLRAAARTCWACPAGRVGGVERLVGPFGSFCGLPPGPAGRALPGESVGWKG